MQVLENKTTKDKQDSLWFGGNFDPIDDVVMRIVDAFLSIPWILAMLLIVSLLGTSTEVLILALGFFYG